MRIGKQSVTKFLLLTVLFPRRVHRSSMVSIPRLYLQALLNPGIFFPSFVTVCGGECKT